MKKILKKENAITLIALVITIIVLVILAGVSIAQLTGNGLFEKAKTAKNQYINAQDYEQDQIAKYENTINSQVNSTRETITLKKEDYDKLEKKGTWQLLATKTSSTSNEFTVPNLSQFSSIVLFTYSSSSMVGSTIVDYNFFKSTSSSLGIFACYNNGGAIVTRSYYISDTKIALMLHTSEAKKAELYGIY